VAWCVLSSLNRWKLAPEPPVLVRQVLRQPSVPARSHCLSETWDSGSVPRGSLTPDRTLSVCRLEAHLDSCSGQKPWDKALAHQFLPARRVAGRTWQPHPAELPDSVRSQSAPSS